MSSPELERLREALHAAGHDYVVGTDHRLEWHLDSCPYAQGGWKYGPDDEDCAKARAALGL